MVISSVAMTLKKVTVFTFKPLSTNSPDLSPNMSFKNSSENLV